MATSGVIENIYIRGLSCAVPDNSVSNEEFIVEFAEGVEKFAKMTGVNHRYKAKKGQTTSDLCYVAAKRLIEQKNVKIEDVEAVIFVSQTPDYQLPATACVLQERLEIKSECIAFDINLGCSGFIYGLYLAALMTQAGCANVLLCGGDTLDCVSRKDRSTAMLFGDAGFAALVSRRAAGEDVWHYRLMSDGRGFKNIIVPSGAYRNREGDDSIREFDEGIFRSDFDMYMNGPDVFSFTISEVPNAINNVMKEAGSFSEKIDFLVLHQANLFILKQISKMTKFPMDKVPCSLDRFGNTSSASIPLTLCDLFARSGDQEMKEVLLAGFGVGLSWGVMKMRFDPKACIPIAFSNEVFEDGALQHV